MRSHPYFRVLSALGSMLLTLMPLSALLAQPDASIIEESTTAAKGKWHVVITETIKTKLQKDWTEVYNANVQLYKDGQLQGSFKGSTLPNNKPTSTMPADWQYSVATATCALPKKDGAVRYYKWTRGKRADGKRPCLRLAKKVPTVNVGSARKADQFIAFLIDHSLGGNYFYAEDILVHSGWSLESRGSAGCLTIHPNDQKAFFDAIPEGTNGTLELNRGIEDEEKQQSYCY